MTEEVTDAMAKVVFDAMVWAVEQPLAGRPPTWFPGGNSFAQDRARQAVRELAAMRSASNSPTTNGEVSEPFQQRVAQWMDACFTPAIKADKLERCDRFIEEALELAQTNPAFTADRAHALVDYVFARPVGETGQEVGGVMVTLAALCGPFGVDMTDEAEREVARITHPAMFEKIRAKQAAKPTGSALPIAHLTPRAASDDEERLRSELAYHASQARTYVAQPSATMAQVVSARHHIDRMLAALSTPTKASAVDDPETAKGDE